MASNALSQKSFSTKTPVICKPPPLPPIVLPPPFTQTTFYVSASLKYEHPMFPVNMAGAVTLTWHAPQNRYYGYADANNRGQWIEAEIWSISTFPTYRIQITYHWYPFFLEIVDWQNEQFPGDRPFVGEHLSHSIYAGIGKATAVAREIPL